MQPRKPSDIVIYAGTFDPITNGHTDIIERASALFDKLIVAVVTSPVKPTVFTYEKRLEMAVGAAAELNLPNVRVEGFTGLLVDFVLSKGSDVIIRGLRAVSDYEYETQMALMNRKISKEVDTLFLMTSEDRSSISASNVRVVAKHGGDVSQFVPACVKIQLDKLFADSSLNK